MADKPNTPTGRQASTALVAIPREENGQAVSSGLRSRAAKHGKRRHRKASGEADRRGTPRRFPADTLEEAMKVPMAIKKFNSGNAWPAKEVAKAIGLSVKNVKVYYLTASSRDYGLTTGTSRTEEIALTELGRRLVYPKTPDLEADAVREALFGVELFKSVFEYYKGEDLPDIKYLSNTLETQFKLSPGLHEEFIQFYKSSRDYLNKFVDGRVGSHGIEAGNRDSSPVIVGEPASKTTLRAFVAMPFTEKSERYVKGFFDEVLKNLITPAGVEAGFKVETARREGSDIIQSTIVNELMDADLVIIDLTEHNPNVLFELGLRIAFEKPIALIKAEGTAPIFDVDAMLRVASYSPTLWKTTLEKDVPRIAAHIRGAWESRGNPQTWLKLLKKA